MLLSPEASRRTLGCTEPSLQWVQVSLCTGLERPVREACTQLHLVSRLIHFSIHLRGVRRYNSDLSDLSGWDFELAGAWLPTC